MQQKSNPTLHIDAASEQVVVKRDFKQLNGILNFASASSVRLWGSAPLSAR